MHPQNALDLDPPALRRCLSGARRPERLARAVMARLYREDSDRLDHLPGLSAADQALVEECLFVRSLDLESERLSADGTLKLLWRGERGESFETVMIPEGRRLCVCLSSQAGCALGCRFCATARLGLQRNLETWEIVEQARAGLRRARLHLGAERRLTNVVFMGMGEPLQNWDRVRAASEVLHDDFGFAISQRRISVSTAGVVPGIRRLREESGLCLSVSLNHSSDAARSSLMPINRKWPLAALRDELLRFDPRWRGLFIEYVLLRDENDSDEDARRVAEWLAGLNARVNLIPHNPFPGSAFLPSEDARVQSFKRILIAAGFDTRVRRNRGLDVYAACGTLHRARAELAV